MWFGVTANSEVSYASDAGSNPATATYWLVAQLVDVSGF